MSASFCYESAESKHVWTVGRGRVGGEREKGEKQIWTLVISLSHRTYRDNADGPSPSIVVDNRVPAVPSLSFIRRCVSSGMAA